MGADNYLDSGCSTRMQSPLDFVHKYYSDFSTLDLEAIARHFREPCLSIGQAGVFVAINRVALVDAFSPLMQELRAKGYGHSEFTDPEVTMLSKNAALARGVAVRYSTDGRELERVPISYLLHSNGADWKIAVMVLAN